MILDRARQDRPAIDLRRLRGGNGRFIGLLPIQHLAHGPSRVMRGNSFDLRIGAEES